MWSNEFACAVYGLVVFILCIAADTNCFTASTVSMAFLMRKKRRPKMRTQFRINNFLSRSSAQNWKPPIDSHNTFTAPNEETMWIFHLYNQFCTVDYSETPRGKRRNYCVLWMGTRERLKRVQKIGCLSVCGLANWFSCHSVKLFTVVFISWEMLTALSLRAEICVIFWFSVFSLWFQNRMMALSIHFDVETI